MNQEKEYISYKSSKKNMDNGIWKGSLVILNQYCCIKVHWVNSNCSDIGQLLPE